MKDARNEAKAKANLRAETNKALGTSVQKVFELSSKLIAEEKERKSTEASLKLQRCKLRNSAKSSTTLRYSGRWLRKRPQT